MTHTIVVNGTGYEYSDADWEKLNCGELEAQPPILCAIIRAHWGKHKQHDDEFSVLEDELAEARKAQEGKPAKAKRAASAVPTDSDKEYYGLNADDTAKSKRKAEPDLPTEDLRGQTVGTSEATVESRVTTAHDEYSPTPKPVPEVTRGQRVKPVIKDAPHEKPTPVEGTPGAAANSWYAQEDPRKDTKSQYGLEGDPSSLNPKPA